MGTGFITREYQTAVELVRRDCLATLTIVDREMNETKPLSHVHSRQLHVELGSTMLLEVVATYPYHALVLTTANQSVIFASRNLYPVVNVSAINRNVVRGSVVGDPQFATSLTLYSIHYQLSRSDYQFPLEHALV